MLYDYQKMQELEESRERDKRKKTREALKKHSIGKNRGLAKQTIRNAKKQDLKALKKLATPWGALGLIFQGKLSDWMYWAALFAAMLKDFLDWMLLGSLPGVGTVITLGISIFIAAMMLLGSFTTGHGRTQQKIIRSWLVLLAGTTAEMILFGVNFLPIETFAVLIIYGFVLAERKQTQEEKEEENQIAPAQESPA